MTLVAKRKLPPGAEIYPDEWFTLDKLQQLANMKLKDALVAARCGDSRLRRLWAQYGIKRNRIPSTRHKSVKNISDEQLRQWSNRSLADVALLTGFSTKTISEEYSRRGISRHMVKEETGKCRGVCGECPMETECRLAVLEGRPLWFEKSDEEVGIPFWEEEKEVDNKWLVEREGPRSSDDFWEEIIPVRGKVRCKT